MRNSLEVAKHIQQILDSINMKPSELANRIGVDRSTISRYFSGDRKIPMDEIPKIAQVIQVDPKELLFDIRNNEEANIEISNLMGIDSYPYIPFPVSAGLPINIDAMEDAETITIPDNLLGKHAGDDELFFMRVNGDSMNKVMPHKSLIGIKPIKLANLKNEDIVVYSDGYDYSVKRFYQDGNRIIFRPESYSNFFTDYSTTIENDDIRIHGKVVTYLVNLD